MEKNFLERLFDTWNSFKLKKNGSSRKSKKDNFTPQQYRPKKFELIEDAPILPFVYSENKVPDKDFNIRVYEFGFDQCLTVHCRNASKAHLDNVFGIKIDEGITLMRTFGGAIYPHNVKVLVEKLGGRLPTHQEIIAIANKLNSVNASLCALGEGTLYDQKYWVVNGNGWENMYQVNLRKPEEQIFVDMDDSGFFLMVAK